MLRSVYGMERADKDWGDFRHDSMLSLTWTPLSKRIYWKDFYHGTAKHRVYMGVYVDDTLGAGEECVLDNAMEEIHEVLGFSEPKGKPLTMFTGIHYTPVVTNYVGWTQQNRVFMHQSALTRAVVQRFMEEANLTKFRRVEAPGFSKEEASTQEGDELPGVFAESAPRHIGGALYLSSGTRPDITVAVGVLSRRVKSWTRYEDRALKRMMAYLAHHEDWGLLYVAVPNNGSTVLLDHYVDASHADDVRTGRSTAGWVIFQSYADEENLNMAKMTWMALDWASKLLTGVSPSTGDAEYGSTALSLQKCALPVQILVEEVHSESAVKLRANVDNEAAETICRSGESARMTYMKKHQRINVAWVREAMRARSDRVIARVPTDLNVADFFTKLLGRIKFSGFRADLGLLRLKQFEDAAGFKAAIGYALAAQAVLRGSSSMMEDCERHLKTLMNMLPLKDDVYDSDGEGECEDEWLFGVAGVSLLVMFTD